MKAAVATSIAAALRLERPLAIFDIESTGTSHDSDRIIELAVVKIHPGGKVSQGVQRLNPEVPIPPETTEVHGITDADVAGCPTFAQKAAAFLRSLNGCDLAGHNVRKFDVRMLAAEFLRVGIVWPAEGVRIVDTKMVFFRKEPRDLNAAVRFFVGNEEALRHAEVAHGALADVEATMEVLAGQLELYADLPRSLDELHEFCTDRKPGSLDDDNKIVWKWGEAAIGFGKHSGRSLREMAEQEPGYLRWMTGADFSAEVKEICARALAGQFPERAEEARP